ncbi:MAG: glycogen synthase GlgA [Burkholderiaceae bacterium]
MLKSLAKKASRTSLFTADASNLRVLFATPECAPWVKTGGLGDVSADFPAALHAAGVDVRVLLPAYRQVLERCGPVRALSALPRRASLPPARLLEATLPSGVGAILVDCPPCYERDGTPYQDDARRDWPDNTERFALLSHAAAIIASSASPLEWRPHILHCNDWPTALAPAYLALDGYERAASLMGIHNVAFQGLFNSNLADAIGLAPAARGIDGAEFYGRLSALKAGLAYADAIVAVSPTYAQEIQSEPLGCGLSGLLSERSQAVSGIVNGIDTELWNPATDPLIARRYDVHSLGNKGANKAALQRWAQLPQIADLPLFGLVSRLTEQKGIDVLAAAADRLAALPCQVVVLGVGTPEMEEAVRQLDARNLGSIRAHVGFSEELAHTIAAGADGFLMPSRFEPCGLTQMFSQHYGTVPIVRATGGLRDTVINATPETLAKGKASGITFDDLTPDALVRAVQRAIELYQQPATWRRLQTNIMNLDLAWTASAQKYIALYRRLSGAMIEDDRETLEALEEVAAQRSGTHG